MHEGAIWDPYQGAAKLDIGKFDHGSYQARTIAQSLWEEPYFESSSQQRSKPFRMARRLKHVTSKTCLRFVQF